MKLNNKFLNLLFYTLIVFGLFTFIINSGLDIELKIYNYYYFIAAIILKIINFYIFNQVHYHIFNIFSLKIGISENFDLTYKGYIGNFFGFGKSLLKCASTPFGTKTGSLFFSPTSKYTLKCSLLKNKAPS